MTETTTEVPVSEPSRRRRRLDAKAAWQRADNLAKGRLKRGPHTHSLARTRPWEAMGISESTWKRRRRRGEPGYVPPPIPEPPARREPKPTPPPPDTSAVERALDLTLAALMAHRAQQERQHEGQDLSPVRFVILALCKPPTPAESALQALLRDPVEHALGTALSDLGRHLFDITGTVEGMRQVCNRVAELDPAWASYRVSIMDAAWDGIGHGDERWWR